MDIKGRVASINISENKGTVKTPVTKGILKEEHGLVGDAHAGNWHRQISLIDIESIKVMQEKGFGVEIGNFAENITTEGIDLTTLKIGDQLQIGSCLIEITHIGKECHTKCEIHRKVGACIMPKKGIFARVLKGGEIENGADIYLVSGDVND